MRTDLVTLPLMWDHCLPIMGLELMTTYAYIMFIYWPKPYLLLSTTCDEILSWMIEFGLRGLLPRFVGLSLMSLESIIM
jgi:hypothetical protein